MSPPSSPLIDNLREQHTSKSSDEEITEDENGDENEEEEEDVEDDREGTDESNETHQVDRIPALDEENASDTPSPSKHARSSNWYPDADLNSGSASASEDGNKEVFDLKYNERHEGGSEVSSRGPLEKSGDTSETSGDSSTNDHMDSLSTDALHEVIDRSGRDKLDEVDASVITEEAKVLVLY
ncbi:unnamed protein product [Echinostoma caproni]|uniref:CTNNB1_binding domain-containing protein n=1 Tax=Echinostoma caproni TaxID=27848 RepID=A0A183BC32_9TREM|nr:unnamed protein product [Echinostoma caproni]